MKTTDEPFVHPYIPNSVPEVQREMLAEVEAKDIEELYQEIPARLRFSREMRLPEPILSESDLRRHVERILAKNTSCKDAVSFLGGGNAHHYVPVICDEVNRRSEFLTAYAGEPYEDHGRFQALFQYCSMMGELLDVEVCNVPTYDGNQAASTSLRMAGRITGRKKLLVAAGSHPDRRASITNYCRSAHTLEEVKCDPRTGLLDLEDLTRKLDGDTAALYLENPGYVGTIEHRGQQIADALHAKGALLVVGVDPIALGVLAPPSQWGADISCGDLQSIGVHMFYGGGAGGFIATRDEERFVREYPSRLFGVTKTAKGEWGFGDVLYNDRTSFGAREQGKEFVGTAAALWGITAGVYLALMGPKGMEEVGKTILARTQYAQKRFAELPRVKLPYVATVSFKEFVVDFRETGKKVAEINKALLAANIFGGAELQGDLGRAHPGAALYCVTENVTADDIDSLVSNLGRILR